MFGPTSVSPEVGLAARVLGLAGRDLQVVWVRTLAAPVRSGAESFPNPAVSYTVNWAPHADSCI